MMTTSLIGHREEQRPALGLAVITGEAGSSMQEYRDFMQQRGHGAETVRARLAFAQARWVEWESWQLSGAEIARWLEHFTGWTRVTYYNHLRSLFAWLVESGQVETNPTAHMKRPPSPRPKPKPLTESELRVALETAPPDVREFLLLGYLAGLRRFEIAKLRGEDVTEHGIYVLGKGGQGWTVPTHPLLWQLAQTHPREGYWFPSPFRHERAGLPISASCVGNKVADHFRTLGLSGATHRARHSYGTHLLRGGANLRVVQELMRHCSLATTALYLGTDHAEKVDAINALPAAA